MSPTPNRPRPWMLGRRAAVFVALAALASEATVAARTAATARRVDRERAQREAELVHRRGAAADGTQLAARRDALRRDLALLRNRLGETNGYAAAGHPPARSSIDAFIEISAFVARVRERGAAAGLAMQEDERFGFASYRHEGPDPGAAAVVVEQLRATEEIVLLLAEAGAGELGAIQRERPVPSAPSGPERVGSPGVTGRAAAGSGVASDYFTHSPERSLRRPGVVGTLAFRVSFAGDPASLRRFLNRLGASGSLLAVRGVEVEPARIPGVKPVTEAEDGTGLAVLTAPARCRFVVTIEAIGLLGRLARPEVEGT